MTSRLAFLSARPIMGLPDFCHFLRVVGNLIPPYLKHKGRSAKESASCGWQMAAQKECLFGASRQFLWKSKVWHYYDRQPSGLPGSWTLKMTTGNLICRSTDVAYQVPKCGEPGVAGTKGKADTVLKAHKIQWVDTTIARTFSGRAHRAPYLSFDPQIICGTIGNRRPACGLCRRQRQSVARSGRRQQDGGFHRLRKNRLLRVACASVHRQWNQSIRVPQPGRERRGPSALAEPGMIPCSGKWREHSE